MKNKNILKALEGYPGAFRAKIIWGVDFSKIEKKEINNYNQKIFTRRNNPNTFLPMEIANIKIFLKSKKRDFDAVLNCG